MREIYFIVMIIVSLGYANDSQCFLAKKDDLNLQNPLVDTLKESYDMIINTTELLKSSTIDIYFDVSLPVPYASQRTNTFDCYKEADTYHCVQDPDGGGVDIKFEEEGIKYALSSAYIGDSYDDPVIRRVSSIKNAIAKPTKCTEQKDFDNKDEHNLPFVCFVQHEGECIRFDEACENINLKTYGSYENDYESSNAQKICTEKNIYAD